MCGVISGSGKVGGVVGYNMGTIEKCSSIGNINGNTAHPNYNYILGVGGIVGTNKGIIDSCSHEGYVLSPGNNVGDIAGYSEGSCRNV